MADQPLVMAVIDPSPGASSVPDDPGFERTRAAAGQTADGAGLSAFDDTDESETEADIDDDFEPLEPARPASTGITRLIREWGVVLVVALTVAIVVRAFVFSPFYIPSSSMEPGLQINDRILVNKLSYKAHDVRRQDVVVFDAPPGVDFGPNVKDLVKRVIGLPGDSLEIRDCSVYVNGAKLSEPYIAKDTTGAPACTTGFSAAVDPNGDGMIQVPAGDVFVMGDNRTNSDDGRTWGFLEQSLIVGRAFVIYWPISHWTWL